MWYVISERKYQESINQVPHLTQHIIWESDKTLENITYKRVKRSALSQQMTTKLQGTSKTIMADKPKT